MKKILVILVFLTSPLFGRADHVVLIDKITFPFCKALGKEKGLFLSGEGGRMMFDVNEVHMDFTRYATPSVEEARALFVEVAEKYINAVNQNVAVRPYLHNYPFTQKNIEIAISFKAPQQELVGTDYVAYVYYLPEKDKLVFCCNNKENTKFEHVREETYEEAARIVHEQASAAAFNS